MSGLIKANLSSTIDILAKTEEKKLEKILLSDEIREVVTFKASILIAS